MLDKLRGMIFEDPNTEAKASATKPVSPSAEAETTVLPPEGTLSPLDVHAVEAHLDDAIKSNPAFEPVSRFLSVADSMKTVITDEGTRFAAAAAASSVDLTTLVTAVQSWPPVLAAEVQKFQDVYVTNGQTQLAGLNEKAAQVQAQIDELTAKLGQLSDEKATLGTQIRDADVGLAKAQIDFKSVVSLVDKRYEELLGKIQKYVKGA